MTTGIDTDRRNKLSVGEGIALAGIWLACATVMVFIMLIMFVWSDMMKGAHLDFIGLIILIILIGSPLITAYSISKKILSIND